MPCCATAARRRSRASRKERDDERALKERQNCLIEAAGGARRSAGSAGGPADRRKRSGPRPKRRACAREAAPDMTAETADACCSASTKRMLTETDPQAAVEVRLQLRRQGHALGRALQAAAAARRVLPAVPVHLDHQQLPAALPGLLGRRGGASAEADRSTTLNRLDRRRQGARQQLLRHPRRRAVHAPGAARSARARTPTATSRSSRTASSSPTRSRAQLRAARQRHAARSASKAREIVSDERRGQAKVLTQDAGGPRALPAAQAAHRRRHQRLPDEHRRPGHRSLAASG